MRIILNPFTIVNNLVKILARFNGVCYSKTLFFPMVFKLNMIPIPQSLSIKNWAAWAPCLSSKESWLSWSKTPVVPFGDDTIKTTTIPPMLKRRCSNMSKMALETSNLALANHNIDYAVFCSQHGELNCTINLLKGICEQSVLSPMRFSQSVHNTSAGLFSVIHNMQQNMTSIAAGDCTFQIGMLEALTWLTLNPKKTALLTMFDDYIPNEYQSLKIQNNHQYAVALLLTNDSSCAPLISVTLDTLNQSNNNKNLPPALEFLAWFLQTSKKDLTQSTNNQTFIWHKHSR